MQNLGIKQSSISSRQRPTNLKLNLTCHRTSSWMSEAATGGAAISWKCGVMRHMYFT